MGWVLICKTMKRIFSSDKPLSAKLREFTPETYSGDIPDRKTKLRDALKKQIGSQIQGFDKKNKSGKVSLEVCFYLYNDGAEGSANKDLDNMLKLLVDVLSDRMNNQQGDQQDNSSDDEGLGIIRNDKHVFHVDCKKKIVKQPKKVGIDLKILPYPDD